jgi:hypothetical protein
MLFAVFLFDKKIAQNFVLWKIGFVCLTPETLSETCWCSYNHKNVYGLLEI